MGWKVTAGKVQAAVKDNRGEVAAAASVIVASLIAYPLSVGIFTPLTPDKVGERMADLWAAYVAAVGLAVPLLLLIIEFARDEGPVAVTSSHMLMQLTRARELVLLSLFGIIELGVAVLYFDHDTVLFVQLVAFGLLLIRVGWAYQRVIRLLMNPDALQKRAEEHLVSQLRSALEGEAEVARAGKVAAAGLEPLSIYFTDSGAPELRRDATCVYPRRSGWIRAIDAAALKSALIDATRETPKQGPEAGARAPRFVVASIGDRAEPSRPIVGIEPGVELSDATRLDLESAIEIGTVEQDGVRGQLGLLMDGILRSIDDGALTQLRTGFALYRRLVIAQSKGAENSQEFFGLRSQLRNDLPVFTRRALATNDPDVLEILNDLVYGVMVDAQRSGDRSGFALGVELYRDIWIRTRASGASAGQPNLAISGLQLAFYLALADIEKEDVDV